MPPVWESKVRCIVPIPPSHSLSQSGKSREDSHGSGTGVSEKVHTGHT